MYCLNVCNVLLCSPRLWGAINLPITRGHHAHIWAVSQSEGSMLNGCPFQDANADKHCSNVENAQKFAPFSREFQDFSRKHRWILNEPKCPQSFPLRQESSTHCFTQVKFLKVFRNILCRIAFID
jgi:hypothetical protein